jgi:hypothetical protein
VSVSPPPLQGWETLEAVESLHQASEDQQSAVGDEHIPKLHQPAFVGCGLNVSPGVHVLKT